MDVFFIKFLICNITISIIIAILFAVKKILSNYITARVHYNLWYIVMGLLVFPFIPIQLNKFFHLFSFFDYFKNSPTTNIDNTLNITNSINQSVSANWMNDFSISVNSKAPSTIFIILFVLWAAGILVMILLYTKSIINFKRLKKSALPLQNKEIQQLYRQCLNEMNITKNIPVYSTAFFKSPIISGFSKPCIFIPIHIITDCSNNDIRYMLLHELNHYKHKDNIGNYFSAIISVLYWFNPIVWFALKNMKNDREIACDASVLELLNDDNYEDYGLTLINFAEKISLSSFPFATGISGNFVQIKKRIISIANYKPISFKQKFYSVITFLIVTATLTCFVPMMSIRAADDNIYFFDETSKNITDINLKDLFGENTGSFVLYDTTEDSWLIYNKKEAVTRISPASTYKIYSALFALESEIISPENSSVNWNGHQYMYELWNNNQSLESAMQNSVTWYFQNIDRQNGMEAIKKYIDKINYGNRRPGRDISSYWADSTLRISPIEQVTLLKNFYYNKLGFSSENTAAVKQAIRLYSSEEGTIYGKTGTQEIDKKNTSGWFIGYIEKGNHTYFFSLNIHNENNASGPAAAQLTFSVLSKLNIWNDNL